MHVHNVPDAWICTGKTLQLPCLGLAALISASYTCVAMQMFFFYFLSSRVIRSVHYGKKPRQRLDIFVPKHHWKSNDGLRPVVIYVTGTVSAALHARRTC